MDNLATVVLVGLILGLVVAAARRSARVPVGGQTWDGGLDGFDYATQAEAIEQGYCVDFDAVRAAVNGGPISVGRSYIIPVTDDTVPRREWAEMGRVWYVCGSVEQIIENLWLKRYIPATQQEGDGA